MSNYPFHNTPGSAGFQGSLGEPSSFQPRKMYCWFDEAKGLVFDSIPPAPGHRLVMTHTPTIDPTPDPFIGMLRNYSSPIPSFGDIPQSSFRNTVQASIQGYERQNESKGNFVAELEKLTVEVESDPEKQCKVCFVNKKNICFFKCGHIITCKDCAVTILKDKRECPLCKTSITNAIKVYE